MFTGTGMLEDEVARRMQAIVCSANFFAALFASILLLATCWGSRPLPECQRPKRLLLETLKKVLIVTALLMGFAAAQETTEGNYDVPCA